ncbi:hypothetical protein OG762_40875 [Streptomyces sp. NBC_01136]|uniref:hypothetical protein n=1 Tax=unclassified Streptomyces TaxID=2593676 RepID=UPI003245FF74|nr:hypothetical protein OG762_40875 [Streptomyces sp. NBC_01136]
MLDGDLVVAAALEDQQRLVQGGGGGNRVIGAQVQPVRGREAEGQVLSGRTG